MSRFRKHLWVLTGTVIFCMAGMAQAAEFSAQVVSHSGSQELQGKIYVKGDKVRREFSTSGGATVTILRSDQKVVWMLVPGQKMYMEMPFDQDAFAKTVQMPKDEAGMKKVGTETVGGYSADRYETWVKTDRGTQESTMWIAPKLGVPIKIVSKDGSFAQEYRDIKEGGVEDAVFELPAGYQKMSMPGGMPPMKKR